MESEPDILLNEPERVNPPRPAPPPARRQVSLWGVSYTLEVDPTIPGGSFFPCPVCREQIFDGGIPKLCQCRCKGFFIRRDDFSIVRAESFQIAGFQDLFRVRSHTPPQGDIPKLASVTFGVFEEGKIDPDTALRSILLPFSLYRDRCFGLNDLIEVSGVRFKVLAAEPPYGLARQGTKFQCYTVLQTAPVTSIKLAAVYPIAITQAMVDRLVVPYLHQDFRHVHLSKGYVDQYIYRPEGQFVVVRATPSSGFTGEWTSVELDPRPLEGVHSVVFHPNFNTFPRDFLQLPPSQLHSILTEGYLRPYYTGWYRPVRPNEPVQIGGLEFTGAPQTLGFGFVGSRTNITVMLGTQPQLIVQCVDLGALQNILRLTQVVHPRGGMLLVPSTRPDVISALPSTRLSEPRGSDEASICTVCLCPFQVGEELKTLPCCNLYP